MDPKLSTKAYMYRRLGHHKLAQLVLLSLHCQHAYIVLLRLAVAPVLIHGSLPYLIACVPSPWPFGNPGMKRCAFRHYNNPARRAHSFGKLWIYIKGS